MDWLEGPEPSKSVRKIRDVPAKISKSNARQAFDLDELMRPKQSSIKRLEPLGSTLVVDHGTGLIWQVSGTRFPVNWKEGHAYIEGLNLEEFQGFDCWRMPTAAELLTIISPPSQVSQGSEICLEPIFDLSQHRLWSSDRATFTSAWYASLGLGFIDRSDLSSYYYVKGVVRSGG
jgi:serine/threonine-protein kinase